MSEQIKTIEHVKWVQWPINWSAVIAGSLATLALLMVFGLIGISIGAHLWGLSRVVLEWKTLAWLGLLFNVGGVFFAFAGGGWVACRLAGARYSEYGMIQGAMVWLVTLPLLVFCAAQGAGTFMGSWLGGLASNHPAWSYDQDSASSPARTATITAVDPAAKAKATTFEETAAAKATRNAALGVVAALLLGLMGCVLGGWLASGEAMTLSHWSERKVTLISTG